MSLMRQGLVVLLLCTLCHAMSVYILNLRERRERLANTVDLLARSSLPPGVQLNVHRIDAATVSDALHGQHAYPEWRMHRVPALPGVRTAELQPYWTQHVTHGEVACFMSHMRAAMAISDSSDEMHMVLEDDVDFDPSTFFYDVAKVHAEVVAHDPNWHYISLGHAKLDRGSRPIGPSAELPGYFYQTHAQLVSTAGAIKTLSRNISHNIIAYDEWLHAARAVHPRDELNSLYYAQDDPFRIYASIAKLAKQRPSAVHDTRLHSHIMS